MGEPIGKVVSVLAAGPLGPFADAYKERLTRRGYTPVTTAKHVIHLGHLSRWLEVHGMGPADLTRAGWAVRGGPAGSDRSSGLLAAGPAATAGDPGRAGCGIGAACSAAGLGG